ncbi:MAG: TldD/PmbA family protein [Bacilli bacterium]|nr:TldD/PmbA family protein [Bacilli bacterium]
MKKEKIENILEQLLSTGGDFAEVFLENRYSKAYNYVDNKLDAVNTSTSTGVGLRLAKENNFYYGSTNDFSEKGLNKIIDGLKQNIKDKVIYKNIALNPLKKYTHNGKNIHSDEEIKAILKEINDKVRKKDKRITQVNITVQNLEQTVTIANQSGRYVSEDRIRTRLFIRVNLQDGSNLANVHYSKGLSIGNELLDSIDYDAVIDELVQTGIDKLYAKPCMGKVMPVIIGPAFGGVIFHEACGHAMEATSVADHLSVLSDDLNQTIAAPKVTIIDDGTLSDEWGSTQIDDEGLETQKNVLIQDGVLKGYLIDELNSRKMDMAPTGSARRQNYTYAPTSRMNNTYLQAGTDSIDDMIKSIDLGLYAKEMGGGCVSTETGDFNFSCDVAYMIRDGKIAECVKAASLIGNTKEILKNVEMVSDNLELGQGMCGSISGSVPVNVGQPTIKLSGILVGGEANEE